MQSMLLCRRVCVPAGGALLVSLVTVSRADAQAEQTPAAGELNPNTATGGTAAPAPRDSPSVPNHTQSAPQALGVEPSTSVALPAEGSPTSGKLYGFIEERFNATSAEPNGDIHADGSPSRWAPVVDLAIPSFHIMAQGTLYSRFRYYFNLAAPDADAPVLDVPVGVRNAWLEVSLLGDYLNIRAGKLYRRFGLYNEILDTVPSFIGIEPPVSITGNRPMLTRTTNIMVHGKASIGDSTLSYSATAGKDEASVDDAVWSPGFDLSYDWNSTVLLGTSLYTTAGAVVPDVALGAGSPAGGVAPWMAEDRYQVYGGYGRVAIGSFLVQGEAWFSPHHAVRDPEKVLVLGQNATHFSDANRERLGVTGSVPTADQVIRNVDYTYRTFDVRAAYTFEVGSGSDPTEITPYADFDYIHNPESISDPDYGGDGQPGESPRGSMMHARLGVVFKPVPVVAFKLELTHALVDYGNQFASDEEVWMSLSYQWELVHK